MNPLESVDVDCPYCGERIEVSVDCSAASQVYVEDCQICCHPITMHVSIDAEGAPAVTARHQDDG